MVRQIPDINTTRLWNVLRTTYHVERLLFPQVVDNLASFSLGCRHQRNYEPVSPLHVESLGAQPEGAKVTTEAISIHLGYRAPLVCRLVGISYRQLDYWARTDLIKPSIQDARGSGSQRLYSFPDVVQLKVIKRLLDAGMSLKRIRQAVEILRQQLRSERPLADVTLLSDGSTIYAATSPDEVIDVFRRGQGVFGIAVGPVQDELEGELHDLYPEFEGEAIAKAEAT